MPRPSTVDDPSEPRSSECRGARARGALVVGVAAISFAAIFFRLAPGTHPLVAAGTRLAIAALILAPHVLRARARGRLDGRAVRAAAVGGVLYAVHFGAWVASLGLVTVAASVTLVTATPIFLALIALATGRDLPTVHHGVAIAVALPGVLLIAGDSLAGSRLAGVGLALLGAAAMGLFMLVARGQKARLDAWAYTGLACAVGAVVLLGTAVATGVPLELGAPAELLPLALSALVPQIVGHGCLTWSLRELKPTTVGLATIAEPVGSTLLAWLWLREIPSTTTLGGCAIVLAAVVITLRAPRRPATRAG